MFWRIKLPLILPTIGIVAILTFVGNFNAFDLIYTVQGRAGRAELRSTDILGTFFYRTFFGFQLQLGDPTMGATVATMMFLIILVRRRRLSVRRAAPRADATSCREARAMQITEALPQPVGQPRRCGTAAAWRRRYRT